MIQNRLFLILSIILLPFLVKAQVVINEYSCSNKSDYATPGSGGSFDDWIELYNTGATAVNLSGYYLSDKTSNPTQWVIPAGVTINPGARFMFFATGDDGLFGGSYHTNFKITQTKGDQVVLADPTGVIIDSINCFLTQRNHSRGRTTDGAATWAVFNNPTPTAANTGAFVEYAPWVTFSVQAGVYAAAQSVTISCSDPTATIRYTTDGSVPTATSTVYTGAINIATTTALRAAAFPASATYLRGFVETNTYLINVSHTMNIVSVCGNYTGLFGGGGGNEIVTSFELFDETPAHTFVHEGDGDMNPHGNDSWAFPQKGIRFFPRDEYGYDNNVEHQIFKNSTRDEFGCLIIKAGASDNYPFATTQNGLQSCHMRDLFVQTLAMDHGLHLDGRKYEPCVLYVNGQYWGLYELRERVDKDFTEFYYNQSKKDVDIIRYWGGLIIDEGTYGGWDSLYNFIMANNMTVQVNYDSVINRLDPLSLIDNFCLNTYINNSDWLNWNTAWWRGRKSTVNTPKVRFKYWLWDEDNVFDLGENYTGLPSTTFDNDPCEVLNLPQFTGPNVGSNQGHVKILNKLLTNPNFQSMYINRSAELFNTVLRCDTFDAHLARIVARMSPEMPNQIARWGGNMAQWQANINYMQGQWTGKCAVIDTQYVDCFTVTGPFPITVNVVPAGAGNVTIGGTYTPTAYPYTGNYYGGVTLGFNQTPNAGYVFDYWEVIQDTLSPNINADSVDMFTDSPASVIAHYKPPFGIVNADTTVCGTQQFLLVNIGGSTFNWSTTTSATSLGTATSVSVSPSVTTSYICATDLGSDTITITVNAIPTFSLGADQLLCDQAGYVITPSFTNPTLPSYTYTWQDNSNPTIYNASVSGSYSLKVDNLGCIVNDTMNLILSTTPVVNLGQDQLFCDGVTTFVNLNAPIIATATYSWQDGSTANSLTANQDGLYWLIVNNQGCIDQDSVSFVFSSTPVVNFGTDQLFCDGRPGQLLDATSAPSATYLWQDGSTNPTLNATQDQLYWVHIDNKGCKASDSVSFVFSSMPKTNLGPDIPTCTGVTHVDLVGDSAANATSTYLWQDNSTLPTYYVNQTGNYSVTVNNKGCIASDAVFLFIGTFPIVNLGPDKVICPDDVIKLNVEQSNVEATWEDGSNYLYHYVDQPGTYMVSVVSTTGCITKDTVIFSASGLEGYTLGDDLTICYGDSITIQANAPSNATNYTWNTGIVNQALSIKQAGEYSITVKTNECVAKDKINVTQTDCENCHVYVPSAFSPNEDNSNDAFFVRANCPVASKYYFVVYDRLGRKVWESRNLDDEWKGDVNGAPIPEGVYTYHLDCMLMDDGREKRFEQGGTITLIR